MKKILTAILASALILSLSGCEDPEKQETTTPAETTVTTTVTTTTTTAPETTAETTTTAEITASETTTSKIGGFIVYDELPEDGDTWEEIGIE